MTGFGAAGALAAFVTPVAVYATGRHLLNADFANLTPLFVLAVCIVAFVIGGVGSTLYSRARGHRDQIYVPVSEVIEYKAYPYEPGSELRKLSSFASDVFHGDTMDAEIVQEAVASGAAIGLRVTDARDLTIGFIDVFHLEGGTLEKWKRGQIQETVLKSADFVTIPKNPGADEKLELMFGAVYLKPPYELGLPFQLVDIAENFVRRRCAGFSEVIIHATIFRDNGLRLARACGFKQSIVGEERKPYGGGHDLWTRRMRPGEPCRALRGIGGTREVLLTLVED